MESLLVSPGTSGAAVRGIENPFFQSGVSVSYQIANQLSTYLSSLFSSLSPAGQAALTSIGGTLANNPQGAVRALWALALTEIRDPAVLRSALAMARPALGVFGLAAAEIQLASVALTGMTVGVLIMEIMFWIAVAALVLMLLLLVMYLIGKLIELIVALVSGAMQWNPGRNRTPTPMQTPNWGRLLNCLPDPGIGPIYCIQNRAKPAEITA